MFKLSAHQRNIFFDQMMFPNTCIYNIGARVNIKGKMDSKIFESSCQYLVDQHEMLRCRIVMDDTGEPEISFPENLKAPFNYIDFTTYADPANSATKFINQKFTTPFDDLINSTLHHFYLIKVSNENWIFFSKYHHIITDGWGTSLIYSRLTQFYNEIVKFGNIHNFYQFPYIKFIREQEEYRSSEEYSTDCSYWKERLVNVPSTLIPRLYTNKLEIKSGHKHIMIPNQKYQQWIQFVANRKLSIFHLLLAALYTYFSRCYQQPDLAIGVPILNRRGIQQKRTIGLFTSIMPLRIASNREIMFTALLKLIKDQLRQDFRHQRLTFGEVLHEAGMNSQKDRHFVNIYLSYEKHDYAAAFDQCNCSVIPLTHFQERAPLCIYVREFEEMSDVKVDFDYNYQFFDKELIESFVASLVGLIDQVIDAPDRSINSYNLIGTYGQKILERTNSTFQPEIFRLRSIHSLWREQLTRVPNNIAVAYEDSVLTYSELSNISNQLAFQLENKYNCQPGNIIGVSLNRSADLMVAIWGILKLGCTYLPIDPTYPVARKKHLVKDSNLHIVLTEKEYEEDFNGLSVVLKDIISKPESNYTFEEVTGEDLYAIYTSGSTGEPKGVIISHDSVLNLIMWLNKVVYDNVTPSFTTLLTASLNFDASVQQLYSPLLNGTRLVISPEEDRTDARNFVELLTNNRVDVFDITPSFLHEVVKYLLENNQKLSTSFCLVGGEVLHQQLVLNFKKVFPSAKLINVYGVTEATVNSSFDIVDDGITDYKPTIGYTLPNTTIYILDENMKLQPPGAIGEMFIGGEGLAKGYLNNPELTFQKFVDNPFNSKSKLYRSGDLARVLSDGKLDYLGRSDNQIKIRGTRLDLTEIENRLLKHEKISAAKATLWKDVNGNPYIIAYYVGKREVPKSDLNAWLKIFLPNYAIPAFYLQIEEFKRNKSGKITLSDLPEPSLEVQSNFLAKSNEELQVTKIFERVLGMSASENYDNFFAMGGHSLKAVKIANEIKKLFNVSLTVKEIFDYPTISELASLLANSFQKEIVKIPKAPTRESYELSPMQKSLWIFYQLNEWNAVYNMCGVFHLKGDLNLVALEKSINMLIERHESLRTEFVVIDGVPRQRVKDPIVVYLEIDMMELPGDSGNKSLDTCIENEVRRGFDITQAPLLRAKVIKLSPQKNVMIITVSHIIADGWSVNILLRELSYFYNSIISGRQPSLKPLTRHYKDYALWVNAYIESSASFSHRKFWNTSLSGELSVLNLPTTYPRPLQKTFTGGSSEKILDPHSWNKLKTMAQDCDASLVHILSALVRIFVFRYAGQRDIIIGTPVSGRDLPLLEDQVGFYINNLCIRSPIQVGQSFVDSLLNEKKFILEALNHGIYPFDKVIEEIEVENDPGRNPLFDIMILYEENSEQLCLDNIDCDAIPLDDLYSKYDLTFQFTPVGGALEVKIIFKSSLFSGNQIRLMINNFLNLLVSVLANPKLPVNTLEYLDIEEKQDILNLNNDNNSSFEEHETLQSLFERQVSLTPQAIALVSNYRHFSYLHLNSCANHLAMFLRTNYNICSNTPVVLLLEKSEWVIISILGILKSGGCYVPLDPDYPEERVNFVVQDVVPTVIITDMEGYKSRSLSSFPCIYLPENWSQILQFEANTTESYSHSLDLCYILYTSGSTGKPKGVMMEHQPVVNRIQWMWKHYQFGAKDIVLQKTPYVFDVSAWEIFMPLAYGARLVLCPTQITHNYKALLQLMIYEQISAIHFVPGILNSFLHEIDSPPDLQSLRMVIASGEELRKDTCKRYYDKFKAPLHNLYGPTEAAIDVTYYETNKDDSIIPIGHPISNTRIFVLDNLDQIVPRYVSGQICISGICLARGYLNRPELTHDSFRRNPFNMKEKMYNTGDRGRWLDDGNIEYLGRLDSQVKIRGIRVEPGEIEYAIQKSGIVKDTIVRPFKDLEGEMKLAAYVVFDNTENSDETNIEVLRRMLIEELPPSLVPAAYISFDKLPLNANGKVDIYKLPDPLNYLQQLDFIAPETDLERTLQEIWQEVLQKYPVSIDENFFALGGHSLKAANLLIRIQTKLSIQLDLKLIYTKPTVRELAKYIQYNKNPAIDKIEKLPEMEWYDVSHAQYRFWVLHHANPNLYTVGGLFQLVDDVQVSSLKLAFYQLIAKHEALRTVFAIRNSELKQKVLTTDQIDFSVEVCGLSSSLEPAKWSKQIEASMVIPFDLESGPLVRAMLGKLSNGDYQLLIKMHHIISDAWTINLLSEELCTLYRQNVDGLNSVIRPPEIQYKDYAAWHNRKISQYAKLWTQCYQSPFKPLVFPIDYQRSQQVYSEGNEIKRDISSDQVDTITTFAAKMQCTPADMLMSLYFLLLSKWCNQKDVVAGVMVSGRNHVAVERIAGAFVNFLPFRVMIKDDLTYQEYLKKFQSIASEYYACQDYPFNLMVEKLISSRESNNPFFNTLFNYHDSNNLVENGNRLISRQIKMPKNNSLLELVFEFVTHESGCELILEYNKNLFHPDSISFLLGRYLYLLNCVIDKPSIRLDQITIFTESEKELLVAKQENNFVTTNESDNLRMISSFVADPVADYLNYWMQEAEIDLNCEIAPYNQVLPELIRYQQQNSRKKTLLILFRFEDLLRDLNHIDDLEKVHVLEDAFEEFQALFNNISSSNRIFVVLFPISQRLKPSVAIYCKMVEINNNWNSFINNNPALIPINLDQLKYYYPVEQEYDLLADKVGHIPFTQEYYAALGTFISRHIVSVRSKGYKVIVLDCDNTLWSGLCGESNVKVTDGYKYLQMFMQRKYNEGFILVCCSKNNEEDVSDVFDNCSDMILRREHFITWRVNWESKSTNIDSIAKELNLATDSFIFIDDSPIECAEVANFHPDILALQLPGDSREYKNYLDHIWAFDKVLYTQEDQSRNEMYKQEKKRNEAKTSFASVDEFINSLNINVELLPLGLQQMERAFQLSQRTNQFTLNKEVQSANDIERYLSSKNSHCYCLQVTDKFGDYGISGIILAKEKTENQFLIETFCLSCRVLGRGVEHVAFKKMMAQLGIRKGGCIEFKFIDTGKNLPMKNFLTELPSLVPFTFKGLTKTYHLQK